MKRTFLWLSMSIIMYGIYLYTLPMPAAVDSVAQASTQARITARITLPQTRMYAVSLGTYDSAEEARPDAARYAQRGAAGCVIETDGGWSLIGAAYDTDGEARSVCERLNSAEGIDAEVILFSADEVRLSVSAAASQTEALAGALDALSDIPGELMELSGSIDRGDCAPGTARSLLALKSGELSELRAQLETELSDTADIFSRMVETRLNDLCLKIQAASAEDGPAGLALSSALKQCAVETWLDMISMMHTLG